MKIDYQLEHDKECAAHAKTRILLDKERADITSLHKKYNDALSTIHERNQKCNEYRLKIERLESNVDTGGGVTIIQAIVCVVVGAVVSIAIMFGIFM